MVIVTNTSSKPRALPSGSLIPPGASAGVDPAVWEADKADPHVATWLRKGLLVEGAAAAGGATELDEADILIAKLSKHGIVKTRRSSVESLTAALEKAEVAAADSASE